MGKSLFEKVWDAHAVCRLVNGQTQLLIGTHLIHEVTSPQAFGMLRDRHLKVQYPHRTFATVDHIVPTNESVEPYSDALAQGMIEELRKNCADNNVTFFDTNTGRQGVVHIVGPEQGITQPGTTIACGDSHTATHGAFGAIAFGIGTSQVRDVLATQTIALNELKVRRINVDGTLPPGVYAKDVVLHIIRLLGTQGGTGYAYEYAGTTFDEFTMEERMTVCNMSIEGGARVGYVNPDQTTFEYLKGRPYSPKGTAWDAAVEQWKSFASDPIALLMTWSISTLRKYSPLLLGGSLQGRVLALRKVFQPFPMLLRNLSGIPWRKPSNICNSKVAALLKVRRLTSPSSALARTVAFPIFKKSLNTVKGHKVAEGVQAIIVPGSQVVAKIAEDLGLDKIFIEAGFEWRAAGCSMCLAMNPDKLVGDQLCASSSNRNFKGRQGSPTGRTMLMSPIMVAAAAVTGEVSDARKVFGFASAGI